jgi:hypothetical protein
MTTTTDRWECADCGGDLELVEHDATDASATEHYDCCACPATGSVHFGPGPQHPDWRGCVVPA